MQQNLLQQLKNRGVMESLTVTTHKGHDMSKIYHAEIFEIENVFSRVHFEGSIEGVNIRTNARELQNEPVTFYADTRAELIAEFIAFLKGAGHTGKLRIR